jgi:hypothetical protein
VQGKQNEQRTARSHPATADFGPRAAVGGGPWFAHGEVYDALHRKLCEASPLGVNVELMMIFLGVNHDTYGEIPLILESHGLMSEEEVDEIYEIYTATAWQHAEIIGAEPDNSTSSESLLLPFVRRAFVQYCGACIEWATGPQ